MLKLRIDRCIKSYYFLISSIKLNSIWSSLSSSTLYCLIVNLYIYIYQIILETLCCLYCYCAYGLIGVHHEPVEGHGMAKELRKFSLLNIFFLKKTEYQEISW